MSTQADPRSAIEDGHVRALLHEERYTEVLAIADKAIVASLHDGLSVEDFVRLSLRGASLESLLRAERAAVMRFRHLHEPIALRWEVLQRLGRKKEAKQMRLLCIRHFPERASVWATAGNQALDEQSYAEAEACFERCLRCNARWTAGLAGLAIVYEVRKDWARALEYRRRVVESEAAFEKDDAPSLQRVMRYAAALARVNRWEEAGVWMRRCLHHNVVARVPAEQPVLARVFSRELYAPAIVARLPIPRAQITSEIAFALREAEALVAAAESILADLPLHPVARILELGTCAWLAGDDEAAYALFDEAEVAVPDNLTVHCLLAWTAASIGAEDRAPVERFALEQARNCFERSQREAISEVDACCAAIVFVRAAQRDMADAVLRSAQLAEASLRVQCLNAFSLAKSAAVPALVPAVDESRASRLQRVMLFRAAHRAVGRSALEVALASARALDPTSITSGL